MFNFHHLSQKWYKTGLWLLWITNSRKSYVVDWSVTVPMTLKGGTQGIKFSPADLCNYGHTFWPRITTFGKVTHRGAAFFYGASQGGRTPTASQLFCTAYIRTNSTRNGNEILHGNQTGREEIFTISTTPAATAIFLGNMNTDAQSVCIR